MRDKLPSVLISSFIVILVFQITSANRTAAQTPQNVAVGKPSLNLRDKSIASFAAQPAASDPVVSSGEFYKDIEVLKGMPSDQMLPSMIVIADALGVDCFHCHVRGNFPAATAMKPVTRRMLQMTTAINAGNFNNQSVVACYTCHHGSATPASRTVFGNPAGTSAIGTLERPAPAAQNATPERLPTADEVFAKYTAAIGGESALQRRSALVAKGTATDKANRKFSVEVYGKAPNRSLMIRRMQGREDIAVSFAGNRGWLVDVIEDARRMRTEEVQGSRVESLLYFPAGAKAIFNEAPKVMSDRVNGQDTFVVVGRSGVLPEVQLHFAKDTGLLVRILYLIDSVAGRYPTQIDISEYRNADGVRTPFRWKRTEIEILGGSVAYDMETVQQNVTMDDSIFDPPI
jgi:hypothetical protein